MGLDQTQPCGVHWPNLLYISVSSCPSFLAIFEPSITYQNSKEERNLSSKEPVMEACFLASNSFTKTLESATFPKRTPTQFQNKRVGIPCSTTCCRMESSSPSDDDYKPSINTDWRSFRAKLVAAEKASLPKLPTSIVGDLDTVVDQPQPITVGDKWAHTIHEPERGCLLLATEKLDGVHIFERTVILVLSTGPMGPSGIILNRPSLMSIKETGSTVLDVAGTFSDRPLFFGGPLDEGLFLVRPKKGDDKVGGSGVFDEVVKGLYYGTKESVGCAAEMVKRNMVGLGDFRFFDGYCGWEKEQLNNEIRAGYWTVAACSPSVIELSNVGSAGLWEKILGLMGRRKVR
uniref:uncharacterized protein LOC101304985 n=1 Tax=Fragaria vesca subsp. vesca TaxID=101020 RepID=UPI0005C96CAB|nr:PREDICTED: uncharacterized protein LOC101304985 [Fragaria vesca subsp. vesca]